MGDIIRIVQKGQGRRGQKVPTRTRKQLNSQKFRYVLLEKSQSASAHIARDTTVQNRTKANPTAKTL